MKLQERIARLLAHDTTPSRLITAFGLVLMGMAMLFNFGHDVGGYSLLEQAMPLPVWGTVYIAVGLIAAVTALYRQPMTVKVLVTLASMYLWIFMALAQFQDQLLPTRLLLLLPATVDVWVLVKVFVCGRRNK